MLVTTTKSDQDPFFKGSDPVFLDGRSRSGSVFSLEGSGSATLIDSTDNELQANVQPGYFIRWLI